MYYCLIIVSDNEVDAVRMNRRNNLSCSEQAFSLASAPCCNWPLFQGRSLTGRYLGLAGSPSGLILDDCFEWEQKKL